MSGELYDVKKEGPSDLDNGIGVLLVAKVTWSRGPPPLLSGPKQLTVQHKPVTVGIVLSLLQIIQGH